MDVIKIDQQYKVTFDEKILFVFKVEIDKINFMNLRIDYNSLKYRKMIINSINERVV